MIRAATMAKARGLALALLASTLLPLRLHAQGARFALVIGVAGYPDFRPQNRLQYADSDAVRFRDWLVDRAGGGIPPANVLLVTGRAATRDSIARLVRWLANRADSSDALYVFFSGHTLVDQGQVYFMPVDGREDNPAGQGWPARQFWEMFRGVGTGRLVLVADACRAGSLLNDGAKGTGGAAGIILRSFAAEPGGPGTQVVALLSSTGTQRSFEDGEFHQGLFTHYLLRALRGAADRAPGGDGDGVVTLREAVRFVGDSVEARAQARFGELQTPSATPGSSPEFVLARVPAAATRPAGVRADASLARDATARDEFNAGLASETAGDYAAAERHFRAASAIDPAWPMARYQLGVLLERSGRWRDALGAFREAATRDSTFALAHEGWGAAALMAGDTTQAIRALYQAAALEPNNPRLLAWMANALHERDPAAAYQDALVAVRLAPDSARYRSIFGWILAERDSSESALEQVAMAAQLARGDAAADVYRNLGFRYQDVGDLPAAARAFETAAALRPNDMLIGAQLARSRALLRAAEDSARRLRVRFRAVPADAGVAGTLTALYGDRLLRFDSALAVARRWRSEHPADGRARMAVGQALLALGRYAESHAALDSVRDLELSADQRIALEALSLVDEYGLGETARAAGHLTAIRDLLAKRPRRADALAWNFNGVRHHVRASAPLAPYQHPLLLLFEALQLRGSEMENRVFPLVLPASTPASTGLR